MENPSESRDSPDLSEASAARATERDAPARRPYEKPRVIDHGRLTDVVLGGSPGTGDSSGAFTQQPP